MAYEHNPDNGGGTTLLAVIIGAVLVIIVGIFAFGGFDFDRTPDQVVVDVRTPETRPDLDFTTPAPDTGAAPEAPVERDLR